MFEFTNNHFWTLIAIAGVVTLLFLFIIFSIFPRVVCRMPESFFVDDYAEREKKNIFVFLGRNLIGGLLVVAGPIVMLPFITLPPGSGLLVILMGIGLMDFPGKRKQLRRLLRFAQVRKLLNRMRISAGLKPFIMPAEYESSKS